MTQPSGVHHFAICTANMKAQIEYFSDVLGMELVALYWMHGAPNTWHGFMRLNDQCSVAFVQNASIAEVEGEIGRTHAGSPSGTSAPGTLQHIAFRVDTEEELLFMRDRIRSRGIQVMGHIDHGFGKAIYFAGLENLSLEIATSEGQTVNPEAWIDPEVVALNEISAEELNRFKAPAVYQRPAIPVPQPGFDPHKPHMLPPEAIELVMNMPDEAVFTTLSEIDPPVDLPPTRAAS